jgi:hypothetical protein
MSKTKQGATTKNIRTQIYTPNSWKSLYLDEIINGQNKTKQNTATLQ